MKSLCILHKLTYVYCFVIVILSVSMCSASKQNYEALCSMTAKCIEIEEELGS